MSNNDLKPNGKAVNRAKKTRTVNGEVKVYTHQHCTSISAPHPNYSQLQHPALTERTK